MLPAFPSAVTAVAFSQRLASGAGAGAAPSQTEAARGDAEGLGSILGSGAERARCCLAVGLESGALEVWVVALGGGCSAAASVSGTLVLI